MEQMRERVARAIAPFLEGGREFDKMPVNRLQLREWARRAMCGFNDATQDDAYEAADALQPEIDRRVAEEKAKLLAGLHRLELAGSAFAQLRSTIVVRFDVLTENSLWFSLNKAFDDLASARAMLAQFEKENPDEQA